MCVWREGERVWWGGVKRERERERERERKKTCVSEPMRESESVC